LKVRKMSNLLVGALICGARPISDTQNKWWVSAIIIILNCLLKVETAIKRIWLSLFWMYVSGMVWRPRHRWVDNIRLDLGEVGWGDVDWIGLAQDRNRYWTLGFHEMLGNYRVA
jgi:hypothetical protein